MITLNNVLAMDEGSKQLLKEFSRCPAAAELLSKTAALYQSIMIHVGNYPKSSAQTSGLALMNTEKLDRKTAAKILQQSIDEQTFTITLDQREDLKKFSPGMNSRLESLIFELNNGVQKNSWNARVIAADKGDLARDDFAVQTEKMEWTTDQKTKRMVATCQKVWQIELNNPEDLVTQTFEENLFIQEANGHTDFMRRHWIDCCQKAYLAKHPKDVENKRSKESFLDYYALMRKPAKERASIIQKRVRETLHKAPDRLRRELLGEFNAPAKKAPIRQEL